MRTLGSLSALAFVTVLTACSPDSAEEPEAARTSDAPTSSTPGSTPTSTATPTSAPTPTGPPTTIPADVVLPHQDSWPAYSTERILSGECIDPPRRLQPVSPTDSTDVLIREDNSRREALAVFATPEDAAEEIERWQGDLDLCGHGPQSHTGQPIDWYVVPGTIEGADETWFAYQLSTGPEAAGAQRDPFVTVARVGNAIYAEGVSHPGHLDEKFIKLLKAARGGAVARFLPELDVFRA